MFIACRSAMGSTISSSLGWAKYLDSWWIGVGLLTILTVLLFLKRDLLERVG